LVPEAKLATLLADPCQMEQVFLTLAVNARDAMPDGGKITVRTLNTKMGEAEALRRPPMVPGRHLLLSVSDSGGGMSAETKARIFEAFFTPKETGKGTGFCLPCSEKPASASNDKEQANLPGHGSETILLVEDETAVRELASDFLKSAGYTVLEAKEGADAIGIIAEHKGEIQLLLTHMVMPRMSGRELAKSPRIARPHLRVICMTDAEFSAENGEPAGAEAGILHKPFFRSVLLAKVQAALHGVPSKIPSQTGEGAPSIRLDKGIGQK
jgi:CheY-like chemotaxis protein